MNNLDVIKFMCPKKCLGNLVRMGTTKDGGYILPREAVFEARKLVSFGVGGDISFEVDCKRLNPNLDVDLYDGTVSALPSKLDCTFHRENVYFAKKDPFAGIDVPFLCKMDIEGEELNMPSIGSLPDNMVCLVFELHYIKRNITRVSELFDFLYDGGLRVVHAHGNNFEPLVSVCGVSVPDVIELTLVRQESEEISRVDLPINGLDYPVNPFGRELPMDFVKLFW